MRKLLSTFLFTCAIIFGLGVGYGAVRSSKIVYGAATAYVAEVTTNLSFSSSTKGGPEVILSKQEKKQNQNEPKIIDTREFSVDSSDKKLNISALSYLVGDLETGKIIISKNSTTQLPMASISKLMTAVVADETLGLDYSTTITDKAIETYGTQGELKRGEKYTISELFFPLLLESSNDAAEALALSNDRPSFIADMNAKAKSIGLLKTKYEDASGLSPNNESTTFDLFKLVQYINSYRSYILDITHLKKKELRNKTWFSNSRFRNDDEYVGGKNGFTDEALKTQIALFEQEINGEKRTLVYIILRSNDVAKDIGMLRGFVHKNVEYK